MQTKHYPLNSIQAKKDPHSLWRQMLADGPVVRTKMLFFGKIWFANSWEAASEVLKDQESFGRDPRRVGRRSIPGMQWWMPSRFKRLANNMLAFDKEEHRRLRSLADQAFHRSEVELMRGRIASRADELLDSVDIGKNGNNGKPLDLLPFCRQLPLAVICDVLGLPQQDRPKFTRWFNQFANVRSPLSFFRIIPGIWKVLGYLENQFRILRESPRPGLMSELVQAEMEGEKLSEDELVSTVFLLLVAGHETTVHLIANALVSLLEYPSELKKLRADWSLAGSAIDEVLRFTTPVQLSKPRFVLRDQQFYGQDIKKGELIAAMLGCANFDPEKFERPEEFRIERAPNPHLTFGSGVHVCLGLKLARAECEIALSRIWERFPNIQLACEPSDLPWSRRLGMRALKSLPVKLS